MLRSLKAMTHNIGESFNVGFRAGIGDIGGALKSAVHNDIGSVGGLSTAGGLSVVGAGAGAWYGSTSDSTSIEQGTVAGAAIGASILPAAGLATAAGYGVVRNLDKIGAAAFSAGRGAAWLGKGMYESLNSPSKIINPLGSAANKSVSLFKNLIDYKPSKKAWNKKTGEIETTNSKMSLSKWGYGLVFAGGIAQGAGKAINTFDSSRMGTMDGYVTNATPRVPSYQDNAGATGDLVFALNANRRG